MSAMPAYTASSDEPGVPFAFAGDWHGNTAWVMSALPRLAGAGVRTVYQVGDFGLWPGDSGAKYLRKVSRTLEACDMRLYVVLGNHDDYDRHAQMRPAEDGWLRLRAEEHDRIRFAPRAHTFTAHGLRFASLTGAGSIDRDLRVPGKSWWPQEEITDADCADLVRLVRQRGWERVDVLLSHESPAGVRMPSWASSARPVWFTHEIEYYCWTQRVRLREAMDQIMPAHNIHGHWHTRSTQRLDGVGPEGREYTCQVTCLDMDGTSANLWRPAATDLLSGR